MTERMAYGQYVYNPDLIQVDEFHAYFVHHVTNPDGKAEMVDYDDGALLSYRDLSLWVQIGCPDRYRLMLSRPLDSKDFDQLQDIVDGRGTEDNEMVWLAFALGSE